jgi:hydroxyquinol 1,2-dioxygenase
MMTSLVQHLHAFAREVQLTEAEWFEGIRFLTDTGHITDAKRQEFILLSDVLGLSTLVTALNHRKSRGCTVWQADAAGFYDLQDAELEGHRARGVLTSDADGRFHFRSILAEPYPIPHDGPVGRLLAALGRHPWRPAHLHFMISAPGYERLITRAPRGRPLPRLRRRVRRAQLARGRLGAPRERADAGRRPQRRALLHPRLRLRARPGTQHDLKETT